MGTIIKYLTIELHPFQIAFFRCFFGFLIILPLILKNKPHRIIKTNRFSLHLLRGLLGYRCHDGHFSALAMMPLASACYVRIYKNIISCAISNNIFRRKNSGFYRIVLTFIGFIGVFIIIDPEILKMSQFLQEALVP